MMNANIKLYEKLFKYIGYNLKENKKVIKMSSTLINGIEVKATDDIKECLDIKESCYYHLWGKENNFTDVKGFTLLKGKMKLKSTVKKQNGGLLRSIKRYGSTHNFGLALYDKVSDYNTYDHETRQYSLSCKIYNTHIICELKDKLLNYDFSVTIDIQSNKVLNLKLSSISTDVNHYLYSQFGLELIDSYIEYNKENDSTAYSAIFTKEGYTLYEIDSDEIDELIQQFKKDDFKNSTLLDKARNLYRHTMIAAMLKSTLLVKEVITINSLPMDTPGIKYRISNTDLAPHRKGDEFWFGKHIIDDIKNIQIITATEYRYDNYVTASPQPQSGKNIMFMRNTKVYSLGSNLGFKLNELELLGCQYFFNQDYSEFSMDKFAITKDMASSSFAFCSGNKDIDDVVLLRASILFDDEAILDIKSTYDLNGELLQYSYKISIDNDISKAMKELVASKDDITISTIYESQMKSLPKFVGKRNKIEHNVYRIKVNDTNIRKLNKILAK